MIYLISWRGQNTYFLPRLQYVRELNNMYNVRIMYNVQVNPDGGIIGACQVHRITRKRNVHWLIKKPSGITYYNLYRFGKLLHKQKQTSYEDVTWWQILNNFLPCCRIRFVRQKLHQSCRNRFFQAVIPVKFPRVFNRDSPMFLLTGGLSQPSPYSHWFLRLDA